jgi:hypothetical protein
MSNPKTQRSPMDLRVEQAVALAVRAALLSSPDRCAITEPPWRFAPYDRELVLPGWRCLLEIRRRSFTPDHPFAADFPVPIHKLRAMLRLPAHRHVYCLALRDGSVWTRDAKWLVRPARGGFRCHGSQEAADESVSCSLADFRRVPGNWKELYRTSYGTDFNETEANDGRARYRGDVVKGHGWNR